MGDEVASGSDPKITDVIDITIKTIESQNYQFQVENDIQIKALKERVASKVGIEPDQQRMIFCGRVLADDKTLKDYKIENGRVIHLVKRAISGPKNENQNSANQQSNQNQNRSRNFYRSDNGSILMGTISIEPNNSFFSQLMRQIFRQPGTGEQSGQNQSDNQNQNPTPNRDSAGVRNRLSQIRLLQAYIDSNFAILQDPNYVPQPPTNTAVPENQEVTLNDYADAFSSTLAYMDRLKPLLENWLQTLQNSTASSGENQSNYSILMRITHHMSHLFHLLTDYSVNPSNTNQPLGINVIRNGFPNGLLPGGMMSASNTSLSSNATNSSASSAPTNESTTVTASSNTSSTSTTPTGQNTNSSSSASSRVETNSTPSSTSTSANGRRTNSMRVPFPPGMFVAQSPILLMEVDSTLNPSGTRGRGPSMSINDINFSWGDMPEDLDYSNMDGDIFLNSFRNRNRSSSAQQPSTTEATMTRTTGDNDVSNSTAPSSTASSASTTSVPSFFANATAPSAPNASAPPPPSSASTGNASSASNANTSTNRSDSIPPFNPFQLFSSGFDPYLHCNSNYSMPEVRSASIRMSSGPASMVLDDMSSSPFRNPEELYSFGSPMDNTMLNGLIDLVSGSDFSNSMPDVDVNDAAEFYDMIQFLNRRLGQSSEQNAPNNQERTRDFQRSLDLFSNQNFLSDILSVVFRNSNIVDLLNIFNMSFSNLNRFRQPFQEFVQQTLLEGQEWSEANLRSAIESYVTSNRDSFSAVIANIRVNPEIDAARSLEKFAIESIVSIFNTIMNASSDDSFGNSLMTELKRIVMMFGRLCRAYFVEPEPALRQVVSNYFELYADFFNERMRNFMSNMLLNRITNWIQVLEADEQRTSSNLSDSSIDAYIVRISTPVTAPEPSPEVMQTEVEEESGSVSEDVDFADAVSEMPSTSASSKSSEDNGVVERSPNWQNVVPSEWVPIIKEDIEKQNIDKKHQQPFSDAYLNGMPKKRRLEHSSQNQSEDGSKVKKP